MLVLGIGGGLRELAGCLEVRLAGRVEIHVWVLRVYPVQSRQYARNTAHHVIERAILHDQHDHVTNGIVIWHRFPLLPGQAPVISVFYNARPPSDTIGGES